MNFISILIVDKNYLVLSLPVESYIMKINEDALLVIYWSKWYWDIRVFSTGRDGGDGGSPSTSLKFTYFLPRPPPPPPDQKLISPLPPSPLNFFFLLVLSFTDTNDSGDSRVRERTISYSTLPLPLAYKHSDIYLQLCMWDDYHMFLIAPLVLNRLLLDILLPYRITISYRITIWLIDDVKLIFICLLGDLVLEFCYSNLDTGNRWPQTRID